MLSEFLCYERLQEGLDLLEFFVSVDDGAWADVCKAYLAFANGLTRKMKLDDITSTNRSVKKAYH